MIDLTPERISCFTSTFLCFIALMFFILFTTLRIDIFGAIFGVISVMSILCGLMSLSLHDYEKEKKKKQIYPIVKPVEKVTVVTHTYPYHT